MFRSIFEEINGGALALPTGVSPGEVTALDESLYCGTELAAMAEARRYHRWILRQFASYLGTRVLEVGAGTGTFSHYLLEDAKVPELVLLEPARNLFPILARRYAGVANAHLLQGNLTEHAESLTTDSVVMVNVLEHVANDVECLEASRRILSRGGHLLLFVPASPLLYGSLDKAFGHYRRYTKKGLSAKLEHAGFKIRKLRYFNLPGFASWFLAGRILKRRTLQASSVRFYDRWIVPISSRLEGHWEPPIGQSLLAVALK